MFKKFILLFIFLSLFIFQNVFVFGQTPLSQCFKGNDLCTSSGCIPGLPKTTDGAVAISCDDPECNIGPCTKFDQGNDCSCPTGFQYEEETGMCIYSPSTFCTLEFTPLCGCDRKTYGNTCFAHGSGIKKITKGDCDNQLCLSDEDCPIGSCENGKTFQQFSCNNEVCTPILYFVNPCEDFSSSSGNINQPLTDKMFSGTWKGVASICQSTPNIASQHMNSSEMSDSSECIVCPQVEILCMRGTVKVPQSCKRCAHCEKCRNRRPVLLKTYVKDNVFKGTLTIKGLIKNSEIISVEIISSNEIKITTKDKNGRTLVISLTLSGSKQLSGSIENYESNTLELKKVKSGEKCKNKLCPIIDCAAPPEGCNYIGGDFSSGCPTNCGTLECSSSGFSECSSRGSCQDENRNELKCPEGTECSGLPAYGCYPPGCPVPICLSENTKIRTPDGEKKVSSLKINDFIVVERNEIVPINKVSKTPVKKHHVLKITFDNDRKLEISPNHPTIDSREFRALMIGDIVDGKKIVDMKLIPYKGKYTYDILPGSTTKNYYANGVLVRSSLVKTRVNVINSDERL